MKNLILLMCMLFSISLFAQESKTTIELDEIQVSPPQFTGIENVVNLMKQNDSDDVKNYLVSKIQYPKEAMDSYQEGTSVVQFVVTADGMVTDFEIINSVSESIDEEVIRVIKTTDGMWKPGLNNDQPIAMEKEVSMFFKVDESDVKAIVRNFTAKAKHHYLIASKNLFLKQKTKKALRHYDEAIKYLPNDRSLLTLRGLVKYELGDKAGAEKDWNRIIKLASNNDANKGNFDYLSYNIGELKGHAAMKSILNE